MRGKVEAGRAGRRVRLRVLGQEREVTLRAGGGRGSLLGLLGPARALADAVSGAAVAYAQAQGDRVSCKAGCGACCRMLVPVAAVEAQALADLVKRLPEPRRSRVRARFAAAVRRMEEIGVLDPDEPMGRGALRAEPVADETLWTTVSRRYFDAGIPCPFLERESCSIYADRPVVCREYNVVTPPERCATLGGEVRTVPRPVDVTTALVDAAQAVTDVVAPRAMPLTLALEWAEVHGGALKDACTAEMDLVGALLESLGGSDTELDLRDDEITSR